MSEETKNEDLQKVTPEALKKAEWIKSRDELIVSIGAVTVISSDEDLTKSAKLQTKASKMIKDLSKMRLDLTRPLDDRKKEIMDVEKEQVEILSIELGRLKSINSNYATIKAAEAETERQRNRKEEQDKQQKEFEEQQKKDLEKQKEMKGLFGDNAEYFPESIANVPAYFPPPMPAAKVKVLGARTVIRWHHEIVDSSRVPRQFMTVDPQKIRGYIQSQAKLELDPSIEGVHVWKTANVESR